MHPFCLDGTGRWTQNGIRSRYQQYCRFFKISPRSLPDGDDWVTRRGLIASLMDTIIQGMREGDLACAEIGIELIEEDGGFAFGRILKAKTARALGRCALTEAQKERIRSRVVAMLCRGFMPHEFRAYARLLRRIGLAGHRDTLEHGFDKPNAWAAWYVNYLTRENPGPKPSVTSSPDRVP
jgi:hypothetical protein